MKYIPQKYTKDQNNFSNILYKYFKDILEKTDKIAAIKNLEKGEILNFTVDVLNEKNLWDKKEVLLFFEQTNRTIDDYLEDNEELKAQFDNLYNISFFSILADIFYLKYKLEESENELYKKVTLLDNKNYRSIIYALYENKFLSHGDLAKHVKMTPQNLSNRLAKLKPHNLLYVFKSPLNEKLTYYSLNVDFKRFIGENTFLSQRNKYKEPSSSWMINYDDEYFICDLDEDESEYEFDENNEFFDFQFLSKRAKRI